jgi:hypothetical protein
MSQPLSRNAVWDLIAPAVPDSLEELGKGQYLAKWWKPVPMDHVESLLHLTGIRIQREPYEPKNLPNGLVVMFSVEESAQFDRWPESSVPAENGQGADLPLRKTGS